MRSSRHARIIIIALAVVVAAAWMGATEARAGVCWFSGLSYGQSSFDGYELEEFATDLDDSDSSYILYSGYQFTTKLGAVMGYVDMGELNASGDMRVDFTDRIEASGVFLAALGTLPVNKRFAFFATAGIIRWDQDVTWSEAGGKYDWVGGDTGISAMYGTGFNAFVTKRQNVGLHVEWTRFESIGNLDEEISGHENDVDLLSVGFIYRFGI